MKNALVFLVLIILCACEKEGSNSNIHGTNEPDFTQYVNPFIGTSKMGHVFPGATAPFGMVQLSPQTNFEIMFKEDGTPYYALGSPLVKEATIHLDNGKTLTIKAKNQSEENVYVKSVSINGEIIAGTLLSHQEILNGGEIIFNMSKTPDRIK